MKILAFDTSSRSGSAALLEDGNLVREVTSGRADTHASWLMPAIVGLLEDAREDISSIDLFALAAGPGSFTGLRIGVSSAKGLAWPLKKKVASVSTLESLAMNLRYSGMTVCPMIDARKGEVYAALYRFSGAKTEAVMRDAAISPQGLFDILSSSETPAGHIAFLGSGVGPYRTEIEGRMKGALIVPEPLWHIRASNIAMIAYDRFLSGGPLTDPSELVPVYLRRSEAEIRSGGGVCRG